MSRDGTSAHGGDADLTDTSFVKVGFETEPDEDGWPPRRVEWLWARDFGDGTFELDNTPWFARGVSAGDVITTRRDDDGLMRFETTIRESGSSTLRVLFTHGWAEGLDRLLPALVEAGGEYEGNRGDEILAVNVPPTTPLRPLLDLLAETERVGWLGWETGHLSARHLPEFEEWSAE